MLDLSSSGTTSTRVAERLATRGPSSEPGPVSANWTGGGAPPSPKRAAEGPVQRRERRNRQAAAAGRRHQRASRSRCGRIEGADRGAGRAGEGAATRSSASCWPASPICRTNPCRWAKTEADNVEVRRVGEPPAVRFRAQGALGPGPGAGHPGPGARRQDHRRAVRAVLGPGRQARARADQLHARRAHARARLHRGAAAVPGELAQPVRHRPVAQVQGRPVQVRGPRFLADSHGRSAGDQHLSRRDAGSRRAAHQAVRLHAVLPQRGGLVRPRRARHHPPAPVPEGGAGEVHASGAKLRRAGEADGRRRGHPAAAGPAVPHGGALDRRHGLLLRQDLRHRSVAAGAERVQGDLLLLQLRGFPGAARGHPLSQREESGVRAHAERQRPGGGPHLGGDRRELPAEGRQRGGSGSAAAVSERRSDPAAEVRAAIAALGR